MRPLIEGTRGARVKLARGRVSKWARDACDAREGAGWQVGTLARGTN